jgi:hypothetical protein
VPVTIAVVRNECSIGSDVSPEFSNAFGERKIPGANCSSVFG